MVSVNLDRLVLGKDTLAALTSVVTREQKLVTEPRVYGTQIVSLTRPETVVSMTVVVMLLNRRP